jgi:hypothetical protein
MCDNNCMKDPRAKGKDPTVRFLGCKLKSTLWFDSRQTSKWCMLFILCSTKNIKHTYICSKPRENIEPKNSQSKRKQELWRKAVTGAQVENKIVLICEIYT